MNRPTHGSPHDDPRRTSTPGQGAPQPQGKPLFSRDDLDRFHMIVVLLWPLLKWAMAGVCLLALFVGPAGSFVLSFSALCVMQWFVAYYQPMRRP